LICVQGTGGNSSHVRNELTKLNDGVRNIGSDGANSFALTDLAILVLEAGVVDVVAEVVDVVPSVLEALSKEEPWCSEASHTTVREVSLKLALDTPLALALDTSLALALGSSLTWETSLTLTLAWESSLALAGETSLTLTWESSLTLATLSWEAREPSRCLSSYNSSFATL